MNAGEEQQLSKSARKRANKKAREVEAGADGVPAAPASKENVSMNAKEAPAEKGAQPKAKAKAQAKEASAVESGKAKPASKPAAKPASKPAAKPAAKAASKVIEEEEVKKEILVQPYEVDDGTGGDWDVASGLSKKQQKSKERHSAKMEEQKMLKMAAAKAPGGTQYIPGMAPVIDPKAGAKEAAVPQGVNAAVSVAAVAAKAEEPKVAQEVLSTATIRIPEDKVARVIGPKGSIINMIKEKTGIKTFEMTGDMCSLVGDPKAVAMAEVAVREILEKGFCSMAFEDFSEAVVPCPKIEIANIIGEKGAIISQIKDQLKVEINIPQTDKDPKSNPNKKVKLSIAGGAEGVEKAKEVVNSIIAYGHHEITHPGLTHQELEIEPWQYSFIIGKGGSEMRHIQKNFGVKVNIPRETSQCQNVLVVGEPRNVERASNYVWKVLDAANQPRGRGTKDAAVDVWGDEEPEEDWMAAYMYKRS